jgi:hypothetical protein
MNGKADRGYCECSDGKFENYRQECEDFSELHTIFFYLYRGLISIFMLIGVFGCFYNDNPAILIFYMQNFQLISLFKYFSLDLPYGIDKYYLDFLKHFNINSYINNYVRNPETTNDIAQY